MIKEIFTALEIADQEIRVVVAELINKRINIIRVNKFKTVNKIGTRIIDEDKLSADIKAAVLKTSKDIHAPISAVLLILPSNDMKRVPLKVNVNIENETVTKFDIRRAFKKAEKIKVENNYCVVDTICNKYMIGNNIYEKAPINIKATNLSCYIDLLCLKQVTAFQYVNLVEKANLRVIDIILDMLAICKEAGLFEKSKLKNIIILNFNKNNTSLGLLSNGKLKSTDNIKFGINKLISAIKDSYQINSDIARRLVLYNLRLTSENLTDDPIYVWDYQQINHKLSEKDIYDKTKTIMDSFALLLKETCDPIIKSNLTEIYITGLGSEMQDIDLFLKDKLNVNVVKYVPEVLGARSGELISTIGSFFAYNDKSELLDLIDVSVDLEIYNENLEDSKTKQSNLTMTNRLKKLIIGSTNKED